MRAKAVLCSGLTIKYKDEISKIKEEWCYVDGLGDYLTNELGEGLFIPEKPDYWRTYKTKNLALSWALIWERGEKEKLSESYVNLDSYPSRRNSRLRYEKWHDRSFKRIL